MKQTTDDKVTMDYEGDRNKLGGLVCCFTYRGKQYRIMYYKMYYYAELFAFPKAVRENILQWASMINDPD